jgi:hypothetical protein
MRNSSDEPCWVIVGASGWNAANMQNLILE